MNSTVHVTHHQEERVIQEARIRNLNPQQLLDQLLEEALQRLGQGNSVIEARQENTDEEWEAKLRSIGVETEVSLSDEATRREFFYED